MMNTRGFGVLRPRSTRSAARRALVAATTSAVALGLSVSTLAPAATAVQAAAGSATATAPDTYEKRVQRLVNKRRANHDLPRLRMAACADNVAEDWSYYLAANDEFFHQSMSDVLDRCDARYAGETLGRGAISPKTLVTMWMNSPAHKDVLLSKHARRIGVGAYVSGGQWVTAANFTKF